MRITPEQAPLTYKFLAVDFPQFFLETAMTNTDAEWNYTVMRANDLQEKYGNDDYVRSVIMNHLDQLDRIYRKRHKKKKA